MNTLVIGGSRFLGPHLVSSLLRNGHRVTIFNRGLMCTSYNPPITFIRGDRNEGFPGSEHFDVVIDTCAYVGSHTKAAVTQLDFDFFVHIGSVASYKRSKIFPIEETFLQGEWPIWGKYGKGKAECEHILAASGVRYASIRPVYILGPNNCIERERFIYSRIKQHIPLYLPGNGQAVLQLVNVKDVAEAVVVVAEKRVEGAFNCAPDELVTPVGLVENMATLVGSRPLIQFNLNADGVHHNEQEFPFANENVICDNQKLKDIGIRFTPFSEWIEKDYETYYKNVI